MKQKKVLQKSFVFSNPTIDRIQILVKDTFKQKLE